MLNLAEDGDLVLCLGNENDTDKIKIRVHSLLLKTASKVFGAMFGAHFAEGQDLSSKSPKEVALPEDDPKSMTALCCIIHYRNDLVVDQTSAIKLFKLAVVADKYECGNILKPITELCFSFVSVSTEHYIYMMATAYIFGDGTAFAKFSYAVGLHHRGSLAKLWNDGINLLEVLRGSLDRKIDRAVLQELPKTSGNSHWTENCSCRSTLLSILDGKSSASTLAMTLKEKLDAVTAWSSPESDTDGKKRKISSNGIRCCLDARTNLASKLSELSTDTGLCLNCARSDGISRSPKCKGEPKLEHL
ncbi:MAG: hypothetical protein M1820_009068 [Bogoriella megaspora]|nr:MAG: hypothetical protein M1820_009068 [Bogoriella megaspora]